MPVQIFKASQYVPTSPRAGNDGAALFRIKNMMVRGRSPLFYTENYSGSENLAENMPSTALTGTISYTANITTITGAGTAFLTELHLGQFIIAHDVANTRSFLLVVESITSNTVFICSRAPTSNGAGLPAYFMSVIFDVGKRRGTLLRGNVLQFDKGSYLGVGDGALRVNGSVLGGTSFTAARTPKIGILNTATGNYSVFPLGMATPGAHTLAAVAGGVKSMLAGDYSIWLYPARTATSGYNNPGVKVTVTIAAGQKIRITFPAMDTANGQDSWQPFGSLYDQGTAANAQLGPWYYVRTITSADLGGTGAGTTYDVEWQDAEISVNPLATFDNDAPVAAEFVASVAGQPVYVSCQGQGNATVTTPTSPGPVILPAKPNNIEAAPTKYSVALSPPETIIGCVSALEHIYLMTPNRLQVASFTGDDSFPIAVRPFWVAGFKNPYQLCFVNGFLYGFADGPTRSIAFADQGSEERNFAAEVEEITRLWTPGHVLVAHDPLNDAICFFHAADSLNAYGYWTTRCLMYGLRQNAWIGDLTIEDRNTDMIVSGLATVDGRLEFIAGGKWAAFAILIKSYRFDSPTAGNLVEWWQVWQFTDSGIEDRDKKIGPVRVTGFIKGGQLTVHGAGVGEKINMATLEAATPVGISGSISIPAAVDEVVQGEQLAVNCQAAVWTVRVDGTYGGTGVKHRVDEVIAEAVPWGSRR